MNNQYTPLANKIREELPRLREPVDGDTVFIRGNGKTTVFYDHRNEWLSYQDKETGYIERLVHFDKAEITIGDVQEVIGGLKDGFNIFRENIVELNVLWTSNKSKPLSQQDEKTINFLFEIIV